MSGAHFLMLDPDTDNQDEGGEDVRHAWVVISVHRLLNALVCCV
jgi:hypothetical protein